MTHWRSCVLALAALVTIASQMAPPAGAAAPQQSGTLRYHDAAFTFAYPSDWKLMAAPALQKMKAAISPPSAQLKITDIAGIQFVDAAANGAIVLFMRFRLSRRAHNLAAKDQSAFLSSFVTAVSRVSGHIFARGPTLIGGRTAFDIDATQKTGLRWRQHTYFILSDDSQRLFRVSFLAPKHAWPQLEPGFLVILNSVVFSP